MFSKYYQQIYKIIFKGQIVNALESIPIPYIAAYSQSNITQQLLLRILEE